MSGPDWMYGADLPLLSITFARDITARELLERMGAHRDDIAVRSQEDFDEEFGDLVFDDEGYVVSAGRYGEWAWAWEHSSRWCMESEQLVCDVSAGTAALVLHANEKPMVEIRYAEQGHLVTGVSTLFGLAPDGRAGSTPWQFDPVLQSFGADPANNEYGPLGLRGLFFRLAEELGIGLPHADLMERPVLCTQLNPLGRE
ncbi:DUF6461 domain-containing protein [Streptomyces beigongshangae]|uniref:DUF6461 domain-containing protein n=1 Tax=Streptomyces beigongshangae TaxID=2841597 RepID=UPI001C851784|nr:DUF6461 domain-containing protein [Streptomyces sp. REN17]